MALTRDDVITSRGLDGDVTKCFAEAIEGFYTPEEGRVLDTGRLHRLKKSWRLLATLYLTVDDPEDLFTGVGPNTSRCNM